MKTLIAKGRSGIRSLGIGSGVSKSLMRSDTAFKASQCWLDTSADKYLSALLYSHHQDRDDLICKDLRRSFAHLWADVKGEAVISRPRAARANSAHDAGSVRMATMTTPRSR
jgi:hypothetical protein